MNTVSDILTETTCCFTGHRADRLPHGGAPCAEMEVIQARLDKAISQAIEKGYRTFVNGGCCGTDLLAAETVMQHKDRLRLCPGSIFARETHISLITVVPFKEQERRWPGEWQRRYREVLLHSDDIITLHDGYNSGAYQERNMYMVDCSGLVIAVYGGGRGGTYNTIEYAKQKGRNILMIPTDIEKQMRFCQSKLLTA